MHCYGQGGAGVTLSWGCADEVAAAGRASLRLRPGADVTSGPHSRSGRPSRMAGCGRMARDFKTIGVVGLGTMGAGITEVFARNGYAVVGVEVDDDGVDPGPPAPRALDRRAPSRAAS